jgi:trk system potassium uptake protein TrkA
MKIIVGGAGSVGRSIVSYLSRGSNDIVVVDTDQERLNELAREFDILPVRGSIAHPDVQEKIGAAKADILIAATDNDEVNLVACQVGYTLFHIRKKIARVDSEYYLSPLWNTLFNEKSLPIDLVISPDAEIAEAVLRILDLPGSREAYRLADGHLMLASFKCNECCPLNNFTVSGIYENFPQISFRLLQIVRQNKPIAPTPDLTVGCGDEIYLLATREDAPHLLHAFGAGLKPHENIVIFGGNAIAYDIARNLETRDGILSCKIVTNDALKAQRLADVLSRADIIRGEMMSDVILKDAGIDTADMTIAVTANDKDNLLASLLAKNNHVCSTISLVNSRAYDNLTDNIGENILVDRSGVTISKILQDIRQAHLRNAYSLGRGFAEIWEIRLDEESPLTGKTLGELHLPESCLPAAIYRQNKTFFHPDTVRLEEHDLILMLVRPAGIRKMEALFG